MGYYVEIVESDAVIPQKNLQTVLQIWKALNAPENNHLKNGGGWSGGEKTAHWYSWMDADYDQKCNKVEEILEMLGFDFDHNEHGDINILGYDNKTGQEDLFFKSIENLFYGKIKWRGEDGAQYTWTGQYDKVIDEAKQLLINVANLEHPKLN